MRSCYAVHVVRSVVTPETWKLHHLGIPVPDLDQAIEDYQTLGNATFQPEFLIDSAQMQEYLVYGKVPVITSSAVSSQSIRPVVSAAPPASNW